MPESTHRSWTKVAVVAVMVGCGAAGDAAGTQLVSHDFAEPEGGPPSGSHDEREHRQQVSIGDSGASVEVRLTTVSTAGGQYLGSVTAEVVEGAGGAMTATVAGNTVNRGTTEAPIAARHLELTWHKESACETETRTMRVELRGDGTIADL